MLTLNEVEWYSLWITLMEKVVLGVSMQPATDKCKNTHTHIQSKKPYFFKKTCIYIL